MDLQGAIGWVATTGGVLGILVSFLIEKSEFDPSAFALSMVSIFIAIVGIALVLQQPSKQSQHQKKKKS